MAATYRSKGQIWLICLAFSMAAFYWGYTLIYFGAIPISTAVRVYHIHFDQATASGVINGCLPLGALFGALLSHLLISRFSRRYFSSH